MCENEGAAAVLFYSHMYLEPLTDATEIADLTLPGGPGRPAGYS